MSRGPLRLTPTHASSLSWCPPTIAAAATARLPWLLATKPFMKSLRELWMTMAGGFSCVVMALMQFDTTKTLPGTQSDGGNESTDNTKLDNFALSLRVSRGLGIVACGGSRRFPAQRALNWVGDGMCVMCGEKQVVINNMASGAKKILCEVYITLAFEPVSNGKWWVSSDGFRDTLLVAQIQEDSSLSVFGKLPRGLPMWATNISSVEKVILSESDELLLVSQRQIPNLSSWYALDLSPGTPSAVYTTFAVFDLANSTPDKELNLVCNYNVAWKAESAIVMKKRNGSIVVIATSNDSKCLMGTGVHWIEGPQEEQIVDSCCIHLHCMNESQFCIFKTLTHEVWGVNGTPKTADMCKVVVNSPTTEGYTLGSFQCSGSLVFLFDTVGRKQVSVVDLLTGSVLARVFAVHPFLHLSPVPHCHSHPSSFAPSLPSHQGFP
ncbi:hypothetical protein Pelo_16174 [Pelomyxa schiedti]|nr:hypothetical protein Pelo_16174 [Pelomyxa schiedti]